MRRVHREATERVGANRLGRNGMRGRVHWEGLDGTGDVNEAWRTMERRKRPCVRPDTFKTGSCSSGGVWHTVKRRKGTSYGRNGGPVHREGCGVPQNGTPRDTVHLHRRPPPASTGSCSSSLQRALLHRQLFNHPSTGTPPPSTVHPALHTTGSCSTTPPRAPLHRLLFIQPSTTPRGPVHLTPHRELSIQTPPTTLTVHPRGSIDRLQLAAVAKESLDWVQLTAIDRSLGFSNA